MAEKLCALKKYGGGNSGSGLNIDLKGYTGMPPTSALTSNITVDKNSTYLIACGLMTNPSYGTFSDNHINGVTITGATIEDRQWTNDSIRTSYRDVGVCVFKIKTTATSITFNIPSNVTYFYGFFLIKI